MSIANYIPYQFKPPLRLVRQMACAIAYHGNLRYCPVCEHTSRQFGKTRRARRPHARCMHCGSLERHRLAWLYFEQHTDLFSGTATRMLHVAPEPAFERRLRRRVGAGYLTADLRSPLAMVKMDITDIQYPDDSFDVIYCSHVLEHVPDDRQAMREFHRVLKPDGWAVLLVPITAARTFEDSTVTDPAEQLRLFGQSDHVRRYGPDYVERLREAGFKVSVTTPTDFIEPEDIVRMGMVSDAGDIYHCTK